MLIEILGYSAATLTTVAFIPQALKVHRTNHTKDLSRKMFALFSVGVFLWFVYGLLIDAKPVIIANAITLVLSIYILVKIVRNEKES